MWTAGGLVRCSVREENGGTGILGAWGEECVLTELNQLVISTVGKEQSYKSYLSPNIFNQTLVYA